MHTSDTYQAEIEYRRNRITSGLGVELGGDRLPARHPGA